MTTKENLGPAERIINTLLTYNDHLFHGRPGIVVSDPSAVVGVRWYPATYKENEEGKKEVFRLSKQRKRSIKTKIGVLWEDGTIRDGDRKKVAEYRKPGIFPEVAAWMYKQAAEVWQLDNEFAARWASYAFKEDHRDLKVVLAALMLVQLRRGDPIMEDGKVLFYDEDFRDIGEAMLLYREKSKDMSPKLLLRIHNLLNLPEVAKINRELGFGRSARRPFLGRWSKTIHKWLNYREENPPLLDGLVNAGFRKTVMELSRRTGYKPETPIFFQKLRWKQVQADDGRRSIAIGEEVSKAEDWSNLSEEEICQRIIDTKPNFKRIVALVPDGITRAIVAAAIEAGSLSDKDLIIHTPMLEELGLLKVQEIQERWQAALKKAEDMRAANIAQRVKNKETKENLQGGADNAVKAAVEEQLDNIRVYVFVDRSASMEGAIETAKDYIAKFLQGFPEDKVHICTFNTVGREVKIKNASAAGVKNAFRGVSAGGGTDYGAAVKCLEKYQPNANEDSLFIFIGDEGAADFPNAVRNSNLNPMAFGLIKVVNPRWGEHRFAVQNTAATLGIPCFMINEETFSDPYAIPRTVRNLIASTPVGQAPNRQKVQRKSLVDKILETKLLEKPVWA